MMASLSPTTRKPAALGSCGGFPCFFNSRTKDQANAEDRESGLATPRVETRTLYNDEQTLRQALELADESETGANHDR